MFGKRESGRIARWSAMGERIGGRGWGLVESGWGDGVKFWEEMAEWRPLKLSFLIDPDFSDWKDIVVEPKLDWVFGGCGNWSGLGYCALTIVDGVKAK